MIAQDEHGLLGLGHAVDMAVISMLTAPEAGISSTRKVW
jgi:hypothetical protein